MPQRSYSKADIDRLLSAAYRKGYDRGYGDGRQGRTDALDQLRGRADATVTRKGHMMHWLIDTLPLDTPFPAGEVWRRAEAEGYATNTLPAAARALGVVITRGRGATWTLQFPTNATKRMP